MAYLLVLISMFLIKVALATVANKDCADFFWRDYDGPIPKDAVPAGTDDKGDPLYVGQVYIRDYELLPATIFPKEHVARTTAADKVLTTDKYVKILCSPIKDALEWVAIESKDLHKYTNRDLIPGGSEVGESLYIGRVFRKNSTIVGKIFRNERHNRGIWFPLGHAPANSLTYEILLYNCEKAIILCGCENPYNDYYC